MRIDDPTTEQLTGWLIEEKNIFVKVNPCVSIYKLDEYDAMFVTSIWIYKKCQYSSTGIQ